MDMVTFLDELNLDTLESELEGLFPQIDLNLSGLVGQVVSGNGTQAFRELLHKLSQAFVSEIAGMRNIFLAILIIGIISALFTNFAGAFENHQIADIAFYFTYLLLMTILMRAFSEALTVAEGVMEQMNLFMKVFLPTYFLTVGVAAGSVTAYGYYHLFLIVIYGIEVLLIKVMLPFIASFVMLSIVNGIWEEERLQTLVELMEKALGGLLKVTLTMITGVSIMQSMVAPVLDSLKNGVLQKALSAVPGIGNLADGAAEVFIGSAVLLKNSVGLVLFALLLFLCAVPIIKIFLVTVILKLCAAILGIVADKRMTNCTNKVGSGTMLLLKTAMTAAAYFIVMIAIVASTTNRGIS